MDFRILGPLEVCADGERLALGGPKQRALLAILLLSAERVVSRDRLIEELWAGDPPAAARHALDVTVSRLRKALGANGALETRAPGYVLHVAPAELDLWRFERAVQEARLAAEAGDPDAAAQAYLVAEGLWRGRPLADLEFEPAATVDIERLEEVHGTVIEERVDAELALGRHDRLLPELEALAAEEPLRERRHAQLMLALYRCGRQADALEAYRRARAALVEHIGVEPGPELRSLQERILRQDPGLDVPRPPDLPEQLEAPSPLFGRGDELEQLRAAWADARRGHGQIVVVRGPPGIGRTRLAAELAAEVHRAAAVVLYGTDGFGQARAAYRPTLLVLDDVADATAAALEADADELSSRPVLVVATATTERRIAGAAELALAPLGAEAVGAISALYAPGGAHAPVAELTRRSGGVPQRAHRLAAAWGRAEAARRLSPVAARAASERGDLRRAEQELAGSVAEVQAVRGRAELLDAETGAVGCPFKGLSCFDVGDAELFFGRERLVAEMVARLAGAPLLGVVGPSGSGKSSAVRAGLLAELAGGVLPGSERWGQVLLRPGEHPLRVLEHAIEEADADGRLLVVVDQFEEVFTLCRDEAERSAFVDALVVAAQDRTRQATVVLAVRADFYGRCAAYPKLARLLGANHVLVGAMERDGLRRAIELPAQRARLGVAPDLVDRLLADVAKEPGALPLLSSSLLELWQRRDGRQLRLAAYERTGGVRGAVARLAEAAYARLDPEQQAVARRILLRLAGEDAAGDAPVRRRVRFEELDADRDDDVRSVLDVLTTSRLVTVAEGTVEVAHEALLREWPRLHGWLEDDAESRRLHRQLAVQARDWDTGGRDPSELYRGARLASALDWSADHPAELNAVEWALIDASRAHAEREAWHARHANRRLRSLLVGAGILLLLAVGAGVLFLDQRGAARGEAHAAEAQRLGAQALVENHLDRSLLLARQGVAIEDSLQTRSNLLAALMRSPAAIGVIHLAGDRPLQMALRPDGRALVVSDDHGRVQFLDPVTRRTLRPPITPTPGGHPIMDLVFSRDGSRLALAGQGLVQLLDARTWRLIAAPSVPDAQYLNLAFSPDGRILSVPYVLAATGPIPTTMLRFDARTGAPFGRPRRIAPPDVLVDVLTFSADGRLLVTAENRSDDPQVLNRRAPARDREIVVRDGRTLRRMRTVRGGEFGSELRGPEYTGSGSDRDYAVSPDGRTLAMGRDDGSVHFVDLRTGEVRTAVGRHAAHITGVRFTSSGRFLVTVGEDADAIVWDVQAGTAGETLVGHAGPIVGLALDPHGRTLYTAARDGNVIVWDLLGDRRLGKPFDAGTGSDTLFWPSTAISGDGRMLATAQRGPPWRGAPGEPREGAISLVDLRTLNRRDVRIRGVPLDFVGAFAPVFPAFGPADSLVVSGPAGFLALADPRTGGLVARLRGHRDFVFAPSVSADGAVIATTSIDSTLRLWDTRTRRQLGRPIQLHLGRLGLGDGTPPSAAVSPDGTTVAVTRELHSVDVLAVNSHRLLARVRVDDSDPSAISFSRHAHLLLVGSKDGRVRLFSTDDWRPEGEGFLAHAGPVSSVDASPDAGTLVTAGTDGQLRLWDRASKRPIGTSLPGPEHVAAMALFTPDGNYVMAVFSNGRGYRWDVRPSSWRRQACAVAGRQLTRAEWEEALPGRDYRPAC